MSVHGNHDPAVLLSALNVARVLWSAADTVGSTRGGRTTARDTAAAVWLGPHRRTFDGLFENEETNSTSTKLALEAEAREWAVFWQTCTNLYNERKHNEGVARWTNAHAFDENGVSQPPSYSRPTRPSDTPLPGPPNFYARGAYFY